MDSVLAAFGGGLFVAIVNQLFQYKKNTAETKKVTNEADAVMGKIAVEYANKVTEDNNKLRERLESLHNTVVKLEERVDEFTKQNKKLEEQIFELTTENKKLRMLLEDIARSECCERFNLEPYNANK